MESGTSDVGLSADFAEAHEGRKNGVVGPLHLWLGPNSSFCVASQTFVVGRWRNPPEFESNAGKFVTEI